ncbi:hypothetical protein F4604DRAFT_1678887 [Suillus subluteus]|nr:hypothetical protein F4604DRAFT_1678887 [Suillus subluteus]
MLMHWTDVKHVDGALFFSNTLLSPPTVHSQTGVDKEPSLYLKRFVRKTPTLVYGWFEMAGPHPISTPPSFLSFEDVQLGDLFLHRTDQKISYWLRENSASGGVWRTIALGDKGTLNEDFTSRMLALQSDGNPTWVLPKTAARYKRSTRIKLQDDETMLDFVCSPFPRIWEEGFVKFCRIQIPGTYTSMRGNTFEKTIQQMMMSYKLNSSSTNSKSVVFRAELNVCVSLETSQYDSESLLTAPVSFRTCTVSRWQLLYVLLLSSSASPALDPAAVQASKAMSLQWISASVDDLARRLEKLKRTDIQAYKATAYTKKTLHDPKDKRKATNKLGGQSPAKNSKLSTESHNICAIELEADDD